MMMQNDTRKRSRLNESAQPSPMASVASILAAVAGFFALLSRLGGVGVLLTVRHVDGCLVRVGLGGLSVDVAHGQHSTFCG